MTTRTGQTIGNYTLAELLGNGTFGSVYLAWHVLLKNRPVAIKMMHDFALYGEQEQARFLQEAHLLDLLKHPGILPLYDVGIHEGEPYLIMEYAPNGTLRDLLSRRNRQALPVEEALKIVSQIGQAIQYAHDHGIVHRDVKPANILFSAKGDVLLADFGIALPLETMKNTLQTDAVGTPLYMAPEQFENHVSPQSDQYALACVLYEVLTGRPPFLATTPLAFAYKHTTENPLPLRELGPHIPVLVEQAVLRALAKRREDRFPSITDFLLALKPAHSASIHSSIDEEQMVHTAGNELLFHEDVTVAVVQRVAEQNMVAQGQMLFEQERYEEALACLWRALQQNPQDMLCVRLLGSTLFLLNRFEEALQQFEYALALGERTVQMYHLIGVTQYNLQLYEESIHAFEQALALDPTQAQMYVLKGNVLEAITRDNESLLSYYQAIHLDSHLLEGYRNAGNLLTRLQRFDEALLLYRSAYELDSLDIMSVLLLGNAYYNLQHYEEALPYYTQVAENEPHNAAVFKNIGDTYFALERFIEALTAYDQAIRLVPEEVLYMIDKGNTLYQLGYYQEALMCYEQVLHLEADNAIAWQNVGLMQTCLGNEREAQKAYKRARKLGFQ